MNILFLFYAPMVPYIGGIQRVSENLAKELKARGHNVCYLCINRDDMDIDYDYPVTQYFLDESLEKQAYIESYLHFLKEHKTDVIISQEAREDLLELLSQSPESVKTITCCHLQPFYTQGDTKTIIRYIKAKGIKAKLFKGFCTIFPSYYRNKILAEEREVMAQALDTSDRVCLLSERFIPRLEKYMPGVDISRVIAVNNPNTFSGEHPLNEEKEKVVICVGRQSNSPKKIPLFIDFWTRFQPRHKGWKAFVIGTGVDLEYNKRYARRKHAEDLLFTGNVKDVSPYYDKARFLVMPSSYEGWGMILTEAMSHGCIPCAFDTYESLHDIIDDGVNGIIEKPYDVKRLTERIESLMADAAANKKMQQAAVEKSKSFTVEKIVDKWESILTELCK